MWTKEHRARHEPHLKNMVSACADRIQPCWLREHRRERRQPDLHRPGIRGLRNLRHDRFPCDKTHGKLHYCLQNLQISAQAADYVDATKRSGKPPSPANFALKGHSRAALTRVTA